MDATFRTYPADTLHIVQTLHPVYFRYYDWIGAVVGLVGRDCQVQVYGENHTRMGWAFKKKQAITG